MQTLTVASKNDIVAILKTFPVAGGNCEFNVSHKVRLVNKDCAFEWVEVEQVITPCVNNNWRNITVAWYDEDAWEYDENCEKVRSYKFSSWNNNWANELLPLLTNVLDY